MSAFTHINNNKSGCNHPTPKGLAHTILQMSTYKVGGPRKKFSALNHSF
jgi:hypothetical protein